MLKGIPLMKIFTSIIGCSIFNPFIKDEDIYINIDYPIFFIVKKKVKWKRE